MGNLAGINLKAGDWRKSIEWYHKVAEVARPTRRRRSPRYQFIGNVAWSKLNSKTLTIDRDASSSRTAASARSRRPPSSQPKNPKLFGLQASIFNFRSLAHGASWAAAIDRASAQDLQSSSRVLMR